MLALSTFELVQKPVQVPIYNIRHKGLQGDHVKQPHVELFPTKKDFIVQAMRADEIH